MMIYCCTCANEVDARLTDGREIYPHRRDLHDLPFWRCLDCGNYVGCHHKTADRTKPLGVIPNAEIRAVRAQLHEILDPIWKHKAMPRRTLYQKMAEQLGIREYHTAEIKSLEDGEAAVQAAVEIREQIGFSDGSPAPKGAAHG